MAGDKVKEAETLRLGEEFLRALASSKEASMQIINPPFLDSTVYALCGLTLLVIHPILRGILG